MASYVTPEMTCDGRIVELGAGTGPVTAALLRRGVPPDKLYVIEKMDSLASDLRSRFPDIQVICCGAEEAGAYIGEGAPVTAFVSSLPFRSLPESLCIAINSEIERVLAPGGLYIQFTYALIGDLPYVPKSFQKIATKITLINVPPAKVEVYRKPA